MLDLAGLIPSEPILDETTILNFRHLPGTISWERRCSRRSTRTSHDRGCRSASHSPTVILLRSTPL